MDVLIAIAVAGVMFVTLYLAFSQGFAVIQLARENLRATQILQEKMETIRLYTWDQINTPGFIPPTFSAPFYAIGNDSGGVIYRGSMSVTNAPLTETYASDLKLVTVEVNWTSGNAIRRREMKTLVSKYGLHHYIY